MVYAQYTSLNTTLWNSDRVFARTFYYKVVRIIKSCTKVLVKRDAQYLCTGFGNAYNFILERSSEYTIGVQQSSIKRGVLSVYQLFYFDAKDIYFLRLLLYDVDIPEKKISTCQKDF